MANPFEEEFGTFGGTPAAPSDNPFEKEFGQFGTKAPSQQPAVGASSVAPATKPTMLQQAGDSLAKAGDALGAGFMSADLNGFGGYVARKGFEMSNFGIDQLKQAAPGQSDEFYKAAQKSIINQAVMDSRKEAADRVQKNGMVLQNPFTGQKSGINPAAIVGGIAGAADPSYLVNPGEALDKGVMAAGFNLARAPVAAHVAANVAAHAAFGSAVDAAYQGADVIDGLKKDFDVKQNLESAGMQGAFGAAQSAAPFISNLFKERKIDTTPGADPRPTAEVRTPITGAPTPPDFVKKYNETLQTGSEQDIQALFKDTNIPAPSFEDTHNFVKNRDAQVAEGNSPVDHTPDIYTPPEHNNVPAVQAHLDAVTKDWKNAPEFEVVKDHNDIADPAQRQEIISKGGDNPAALGVYGSDGKVRIFANRLTSEADANAVIFHEALGHHGLSEKFGDRLDTTLDNLAKRNVSGFGRDVDQWQKQNPNAYGGNRTRAAEEVLAEMSEGGRIKPTIMEALTAQARRYGRDKMGLKLSYSPAEIKSIMAMSHAAVIDGHGSNVRGNGFATKPRFMFAGPLAETHNPQEHDNMSAMIHEGATPEEARQATGYHVAEDGHVRHELSDDDAKIKSPMAGEGEGRLDHFLHHPRLYEAYPSLRKARVEIRDELPGGAEGTAELTDDGPKITIKSGLDPETARNTLLHEAQHAVQMKERYPGLHGTDTLAMSDHEYANNPLEKEAYATGDRADMGAMERRQEAPPVFMMRKGVDPKDIGEETMDWLEKDFKPQAPRTWEQEKKLANDAGLPPEAIKNIRTTGDLARKTFIYDKMQSDNQLQMQQLEAKINHTGLLDGDAAKMIELISRNQYILGRITNEASEYGRGLAAMKAIGKTRNQLLGLKQLLDDEGSNLSELTDPKFAMKFLQQYMQLLRGGNPAGAQAMLNYASKPYWWQHVLSYRMNMMLSGLSTHVKSTMDMATTAGNDLMENALASAVGTPVRAAMGLKPGVHPTEVAMRTWGLVRSLLDGQTYSNAAAAFKNGHGARYLNSGTVPNPESPGILSWPTKAIAVQDQFFRTILGNSELYALGARKAYGELKASKRAFTHDDVFTLGTQYAHQDSSSMMYQAKRDMDAAYAAGRAPTAAENDAMDEARKAVYMTKAAKGAAEQTMLMNQSPLNDMIDAAKRIRPGMGAGEQLGKFIVNFMTPFIKVSSNSLMNQIVRRSPLFLADPLTRLDLAAGGARRDVALARAAIGSAKLGFYWWAAGQAKDKITGNNPDNPSKTAELKAGGWSPNAVHENGRYNRNSNLNLSLNPMDLHNNLATMVAGVRSSFEDGASKNDTMLGLRLAFNSTLKGLVEQSWVGDLDPTVKALLPENGQQGITAQNRFAADQAKTFVPNALTQTAKITDPNLHDTNDPSMLGSMAKGITSSIPGLTNKNPISYNVYGQPMKTGTSVTGIHTWLSNGNGTDETKDPTEKELSRLAKVSPAAVITPVQQSITRQGEKIKLTRSQFQEYQKEAGQQIVSDVSDLINSSDYSSMSDKDKIKAVRELQTAAKKQVRETLFSGLQGSGEDDNGS